MTTITFSPAGTLTDKQLWRVWEIWHDPTDPQQFVYALQDDQVVGRAPLHVKADGRAPQYGSLQYGALAEPVTSSRVDPKPISTRDVLHEVPPAMKPGGQRNARPRLLISQHEARTRQHSGRQAKPKPRRRRSPYTRADVARGLFVIGLLLYAYIQIH